MKKYYKCKEILIKMNLYKMHLKINNYQSIFNKMLIKVNKQYKYYLIIVNFIMVKVKFLFNVLIF